MDRQAYTDWLRRAGGTLILAAATLSPACAAARLVVLVDTGTEMPMAGFDNGRLAAGFHKDIGEALAQRMGREARFLLLPRKRIALALDAGQADLICLYLPAWLPGQFQWTRGFFPITEVLVTDTSVASPRQLAELAGHPVATILGYYYPELDKTLGRDFVRDDGHSSSGNLRKIAAGRLHHAITQQSTVDYYLKVGEKLSLYPPLVIKHYKAQCAVSPHSQVPLEEINNAINLLVRDGGVSKILSNYQTHQK